MATSKKEHVPSDRKPQKPLKAPAKAAGKPAKTANAKKPAAQSKAPRQAEDKYTDPDLRNRIKAKITAGDKGGNAGQWSARKAQMVAHEYEAEGGGYKGGQDETQKSLETWGDEHWTTKDGEAAKREDGMHRYLPQEAWEKLSAAEKAATDSKKLHGSQDGAQFVANTGAAKAARKKVAGKKAASKKAAGRTG